MRRVEEEEAEECPTATSVKIKTIRFRSTNRQNKFGNLVEHVLDRRKVARVAPESMRNKLEVVQREADETERVTSSSALGASGVQLHRA